MQDSRAIFAFRSRYSLGREE